MQKKTRNLLLLLLTSSLLSLSLWQSAQAAQHIIIDNGNSALSKEAARQSSEDWNETRTLRNKLNKHLEKRVDKADRDFDKADMAEALEDKCKASSNFNAYWEPNSSRCLDRRSGRQVTP
ncbi:DUF1283 family protein [Dickeya solani]|uniref:DUF1283 family protein n=1 Tax=Dickeya solani TaxID=1089444 RepID=A0ABU4EBU9_9GAMM|nr:DUF1283 family protein [Dickeya solani]MCA6998888.1 DUF1283 family protein [Dickeya solani]MCZ0822338.1 DUF1283 family protein [Dickeya solani]MDV6994563.1 DUF1283 family protein [Dickeya solani]MDV7003942.1 DUF1283 family protein [Dickeya solani]MDV7039887.1 DUF1283 family protein [Dickeya solani]